MYFLALAIDFDGTLAHDGVVAAETVCALERLRKSGRKLVLVTGRELPEPRKAFPELHLFDRVVAENGSLLFNPASGQERLLGSLPLRQLRESLRRRGVQRISTGRGILATWEPHQGEVLETIRELGLELQIVFNKGATKPSFGGLKPGMHPIPSRSSGRRRSTVATAAAMRPAMSARSAASIFAARTKS